MKSDVKGCSTCPAGGEQWEAFELYGKKRVQYDYRTPEGKLYSTVGTTLKDCRARRDRWLQEQEKAAA